jgi:importin-9
MVADEFFNAVWNSIQAHGAPYYASYVDGERQGGLINQYQLQYTIDFLVIEEIDYLQALLEAPQVKTQLDSMLAQDTAQNGNLVTTWISSVLGTLVTFSSITKEAEEMWSFDFNVFLSEETFAETNNSPRSVCAGFVWKLCGWFPKQTLESLLGCIKAIFDDPNAT